MPLDDYMSVLPNSCVRIQTLHVTSRNFIRVTTDMRMLVVCAIKDENWTACRYSLFFVDENRSSSVCLVAKSPKHAASPTTPESDSGPI